MGATSPNQHLEPVRSAHHAPRTIGTMENITKRCCHGDTEVDSGFRSPRVPNILQGTSAAKPRTFVQRRGGFELESSLCLNRCRPGAMVEGCTEEATGGRTIQKAITAARRT